MGCSASSPLGEDGVLHTDPVATPKSSTRGLAADGTGDGSKANKDGGSDSDDDSDDDKAKSHGQYNGDGSDSDAEPAAAAPPDPALGALLVVAATVTARKAKKPKKAKSPQSGTKHTARSAAAAATAAPAAGTAAAPMGAEAVTVRSYEESEDTAATAVLLGDIDDVGCLSPRFDDDDDDVDLHDDDDTASEASKTARLKRSGTGITTATGIDKVKPLPIAELLAAAAAKEQQQQKLQQQQLQQQQQQQQSQPAQARSVVITENNSNVGAMATTSPIASSTATVTASAVNPILSTEPGQNGGGQTASTSQNTVNASSQTTTAAAGAVDEGALTFRTRASFAPDNNTNNNNANADKCNDITVTASLLPAPASAAAATAAAAAATPTSARLLAATAAAAAPPLAPAYAAAAYVGLALSGNTTLGTLVSTPIPCPHGHSTYNNINGNSNADCASDRDSVLVGASTHGPSHSAAAAGAGAGATGVTGIANGSAADLAAASSFLSRGTAAHGHSGASQSHSANANSTNHSGSNMNGLSNPNSFSNSGLVGGVSGSLLGNGIANMSSSEADKVLTSSNELPLGAAVYGPPVPTVTYTAKYCADVSAPAALWEPTSSAGAVVAAAANSPLPSTPVAIGATANATATPAVSANVMSPRSAAKLKQSQQQQLQQQQQQALLMAIVVLKNAHMINGYRKVKPLAAGTYGRVLLYQDISKATGVRGNTGTANSSLNASPVKNNPLLTTSVVPVGANASPGSSARATPSASVGTVPGGCYAFKKSSRMTLSRMREYVTTGGRMGVITALSKLFMEIALMRLLSQKVGPIYTVANSNNVSSPTATTTASASSNQTMVVSPSDIRIPYPLNNNTCANSSTANALTVKPSSSNSALVNTNAISGALLCPLIAHGRRCTVPLLTVIDSPASDAVYLVLPYCAGGAAATWHPKEGVYAPAQVLRWSATAAVAAAAQRTAAVAAALYSNTDASTSSAAKSNSNAVVDIEKEAETEAGKWQQQLLTARAAQITLQQQEKQLSQRQLNKQDGSKSGRLDTARSNTSAGGLTLISPRVPRPVPLPGAGAGVGALTVLLPSLLPWRLLAVAAFDLSTALLHAHSRGIVHRDVKPENVLVSLSPVADGAPQSVRDIPLRIGASFMASTHGNSSSRSSNGNALANSNGAGANANGLQVGANGNAVELESGLTKRCRVRFMLSDVGVSKRLSGALPGLDSIKLTNNANANLCARVGNVHANVAATVCARGNASNNSSGSNSIGTATGTGAMSAGVAIASAARTVTAPRRGLFVTRSHTSSQNQSQAASVAAVAAATIIVSRPNANSNSNNCANNSSTAGDAIRENDAFFSVQNDRVSGRVLDSAGTYAFFSPEACHDSDNEGDGGDNDEYNQGAGNNVDDDGFAGEDYDDDKYYSNMIKAQNTFNGNANGNKVPENENSVVNGLPDDNNDNEAGSDNVANVDGSLFSGRDSVFSAGPAHSHAHSHTLGHGHASPHVTDDAHGRTHGHSLTGRMRALGGDDDDGNGDETASTPGLATFKSKSASSAFDADGNDTSSTRQSSEVLCARAASAAGGYNAYTTDAWALGVTLYALTYGTVPFLATKERIAARKPHKESIRSKKSSRRDNNLARDGSKSSRSTASTTHTNIIINNNNNNNNISNNENTSAHVNVTSAAAAAAAAADDLNNDGTTVSARVWDPLAPEDDGIDGLDIVRPGDRESRVSNDREQHQQNLGDREHQARAAAVAVIRQGLNNNTNAASLSNGYAGNNNHVDEDDDDDDDDDDFFAGESFDSDSADSDSESETNNKANKTGAKKKSNNNMNSDDNDSDGEDKTNDGENGEGNNNEFDDDEFLGGDGSAVLFDMIQRDAVPFPRWPLCRVTVRTTIAAESTIYGCSSGSTGGGGLSSAGVQELPPVLLGVPSECMALLRGLLEKDPARRMTPLDVALHPSLAAVRAELMEEAKNM